VSCTKEVSVLFTTAVAGAISGAETFFFGQGVGDRKYKVLFYSQIALHLHQPETNVQWE